MLTFLDIVSALSIHGEKSPPLPLPKTNKIKIKKLQIKNYYIFFFTDR